jgi:hypothetical protein
MKRNNNILVCVFFRLIWVYFLNITQTYGKKLGKMESNTKTAKKESLKKARKCSNKRKKETEQSIRNLMNANRMAEKQRLETTEEANIRRRKNAENMAKK